MVDAMSSVADDAYSWWWVRRRWDSHVPSPRQQSADRIEDVVYSESTWSFPAFRALVAEASSPEERLDVVEVFFEFLPWGLDVDGAARSWLRAVASGEPELTEMIQTLEERL